MSGPGPFGPPGGGEGPGPRGGPSGAEAVRRVAETGRAAVREVWSRRDGKDSMDPAMRRVLDVLEAHPEFRPYWDGAEPEEGTNPFLHVVYHRLLAEQAESGEPPETRATLDRLVAEGLARHEAEHRVMEILVTEMFSMLTRRGPFDRESYRTRLDRLTAL